MESFIAQVINGLATGSIYALLVLGMNVLVLVRDVVHHGYSHTVMITMAVGWLVLNATGNNLLITILVMFAVGVGATVATEPLFRPLCKRGATLETIVLAMGRRHYLYRDYVTVLSITEGNFAFSGKYQRGRGLP